MTLPATLVTRRQAIVLTLAGLTASPSRSWALDSEISHVLAPSGKLRAGLYTGTPTSILNVTDKDPRGVGYEIGKELARKLHVDYEPVVFAKNVEVQQAVKTGAVDVAFTNASAARAKEMDFAPPYLQIELGYLVPPGSAIADLRDIDTSGKRVGVTTGSTSDATLSKDVRNAEVVRAPTFNDTIAQLASHQIDAFATNKATLFEIAEKLPGSRVLDGRWGVERHAIAIPKGREAGHEFLKTFTSGIISSGLVRDAIGRAGLKGVLEP
jgi:polar amino acid transport system substrate-binding protein